MLAIGIEEFIFVGRIIRTEAEEFPRVRSTEWGRPEVGRQATSGRGSCLVHLGADFRISH